MDQTENITIDECYKYYRLGYELTEPVENLDDLGDRLVEAYRIGLEHGRRNPMPPNLPASFHLFQERFPVGTLAEYARP